MKFKKIFGIISVVIFLVASGAPLDGTETAPECTPGEEMDNSGGCSTCFCGDEGQWLCPEIGCLSDIPTPEPEPEPTTTTIAPTPDSEAPECTPGESKKNGECNVCWCGDGGHWICPRIEILCSKPETST